MREELLVMGMLLRAFAGLALLGLAALWTPGQAWGQASGNTQFKEVQVASDVFSLGVGIPAWVAPLEMPEVTQSDRMVLRLFDTQYMADQTPVTFLRRALVINDAASLTAAGQIGIDFDPGYQQLQVHAIRILRGTEAFDHTASSSVRFLQRETGLERGVYSGEVTASILVSDLRVGDTLEYSYSVYGQNPVFVGKFLGASSWDQPYPTAVRRVVFNERDGRHIAWRLNGGNAAKSILPRESVQDGYRRLVFEERSLPKVTAEPFAPRDYSAYRWLQFSEFASWRDVSAWASELFRVKDGLNEPLTALLAGWREKKTDDERAAAALEFVQSDIRFFSISMGESSHRPTQPDVVLERRYGDCKDKTLLLLTLLHALGISSKPVLLELGRRKGLDSLLPSPQLFDHAIVQATVGGRDYYLDPTRLGQRGRLNGMGQVHDGTQILVVAPETRAISSITTPNIAELTHSDASEVVTLPNFNADAQLRSRQVWRGLAAEAYRIGQERVPRDQIIKSMTDAMEARYPGAKMTEDLHINDDQNNNVVSIEATYTIPKLALERDGNWIVRYVPTNIKGVLPLLASSSRTAPLQLPMYPYGASYSFEITLPSAVSFIADPLSKSIKDKHFSYTITAAFRGNVARQAVDVRLLAYTVEAQDLQQYGANVRAISNLGGGFIIVPKSSIKSVASSNSRQKDFGDTLRERLQETVTQTTQAIQSGKLAGGDLANSHCLRADAYVELGIDNKALSDANEVVSLMPNLAASLTCRGYIYFRVGEFAKSVADYSKAIALGDTEGKILHHRGVSRFFLGNLEDAAEDFTKAADVADAEQQVYSDIWLLWTLLRLAKAPPESVLKRAEADAHGEWPRPARAVLAGLLTPEEMLRLVDRKAGDERTMARSEGLFYLGEYYLGRGDPAKARDYFEKARQQNVITFVEHAGAGFELMKLGAFATSTSALPVKPEAKKAANRSTGKAPTTWTHDVWKR
jgi:lipoprotein NlpI/transglutaminase-like putative cysteine protease